MPLDGIVTGASIAAGDVVIGLPSSGLHSNGYTLARKALADVPLDDERLGRPLGEILLEPTEIYVRPILELLGSAVDVRGLAHITGDGLNNLLRLGAGVGYEIDDPLPAQPIFGLIAELGGIDDARDARGLQHGLRLRVTVPERDLDEALAILRPHYPEAKRIGRVTDRAGTVTRA